jgi:hypothetical protein
MEMYVFKYFLIIFIIIADLHITFFDEFNKILRVNNMPTRWHDEKIFVNSDSIISDYLMMVL